MLKRTILALGAVAAFSTSAVAQGCVQADMGGVWNMAGSVVDASGSSPAAEWVRCRLSVATDGTVRTTSRCYIQSDPAAAITFCAGGTMTVTSVCTVTGLIKTSNDGGMTCEVTRFRGGAMSRNHEVLNVAGQNAGGATVSLVGMKQ